MNFVLRGTPPAAAERARARGLPTWSAVVSAALLSSLAACGGGSDGAAGPAGVPGEQGQSALVVPSVEPAGTHCANGGVRLTSGLDADGDGVLQTNEISHTQFVCNGAAGSASQGGSAVNSLVRTVAEPAGVNCAAGGTLVQAGLDANANNVLDAAEVSASAYVCGGVPGAAGAQGQPGGPGGTGQTGATGDAGATGANAYSLLMAMDAEAAGSNCTTGGQRVRSGLDLNRDGVLDAGEVTQTSYVCEGATGSKGGSGADGATGPTGPGALGFNWSVVTAATQAQPNWGYIADGTSEVEITLPASPVVGALVEVSGRGIGGWRIKLNEGQVIKTRALPARYANLANLTTAQLSNGEFYGVNVSPNGQYIAAVQLGGQVQISSDGGATWTARASVRDWFDVAISDDGQKIVAGASDGVYRSTDRGVTWNLLVGRGATKVASSGDGQVLMFSPYGYSENTQISTDGGASWADMPATNQSGGLAISQDGQHLAVAKAFTQIYISHDRGQTWTVHESARVWAGLAMSDDGRTLVAAAFVGKLYISRDSGLTWTAQGDEAHWADVAMSGDGQVIAAVQSGRDDGIHMSVDGGATWVVSTNVRRWMSLALSNDGHKLVAGTSSEALHVAQPGQQTSVGSSGSLAGGSLDALTLQYMGGGVFAPLTFTSASGRFGVN